MEISSGLWATGYDASAGADVGGLSASIERLLESTRGPIAILFDVSGSVHPFSADVVQGYLKVLTGRGSSISRIYVASTSPMVRFAGSAARLVLGSRLYMFASVGEAITHHEACHRAA